MADIDLGRVFEALNNKLDLDMSNIPNNIDYVIESQLPTASNNYTWYRKYKSGWVEQGGYDNTKGTLTITLPVEMANTNYTAIAQYNPSRNDCSNGAIIIGLKTTTNFQLHKYSQDEGCWEVKGMGASE